MDVKSIGNDMHLITALIFATANQAVPSSTVPFRLAEDAIIVDAVVNSRPVSLMFDTGFGASVEVSDAIALGKPTGTMTLQDFVGTFQAPTVKINNLKLGTQTIDTKDMPEAIIGRDDMTESYGMHCDGIMGFSVIKNNVTGISYEKSRFEFYPKTVDISKWVPDNKRTFLCKLLPTGHSSLEMAVETPGGKKMVLALDTGNAFYATTHRDVLERVGLWKADDQPKFVKQSFVASGPVDSWDLRLKDMKIFGVPVPAGVWNIIDLPSSSAEGDGTVGFGFLHNFNIIVDYERRRVWLENYTGRAADPELGEPGIIGGSDSRGNTRVLNVAPGSPADKVGIKRGDTLLSVDGTDLGTHVTYRQVRKLMQGSVGSKVSLAISREGMLRRYELERVGLFNEPATAN